jgi:hypothetical protein
LGDCNYFFEDYGSFLKPVLNSEQELMGFRKTLRNVRFQKINKINGYFPELIQYSEIRYSREDK